MRALNLAIYWKQYYGTSFSDHYMVGVTSLRSPTAFNISFFDGTQPFPARLRGSVETQLLRNDFSPIVQLAIIGIGHLIWIQGPMIGSGKIPLVGPSILLGPTLVLSWVDQFIWKMKNLDRARGIRGSYGFVLKSRYQFVGISLLFRVEPVEA